MSDAGARWQHAGVRGVLAGVVRMPVAAREHALAVVGAQHSDELSRDARRLVRALGVEETDRGAALEVVGTVQRGVLRDAVSGHRVVDPRAWAPTVRFEAVRAVRDEAARGRLVVTPYHHRLAADRAALLTLRQAAATTDGAITRATRAATQARQTPVRAVRDTAAEPVRRPVAGTGHRVALPGMVFPPVPQAAPRVVPPADRVRRGTRRAALQDVQGVQGVRTVRSSNATRSVRFGAAAALSSVTLIFGAAIAPADDSAPDGTAGEFELDRLQLQPFGWKPFDLDGVEPSTGSQEPVAEVPQVVPAPEPSPEPPVTTQPEPAPAPAPETVAPAPAPEPPAPGPVPAPPPAAPPAGGPGGATPPPTPAPPSGTPAAPGRGADDQQDWDRVREDWERVRDRWERARSDWEQAREDWRRTRDDWYGGWGGF
ncbi:hypothetical protein [Cellulosimicrobium sp. NPDC057127]|uniref:hypothetical protein n=1 Tax=Cellulosimicrobium sp. NPDC057127 TaxID=3346026 RepID=UPI003635E8A2